MIQHVAVETRPGDADACAAFFSLLGFAEVEPPPTLRDRARWLQLGPTQVHLLYADDPEVPPRGHLAVVLDDYDAGLFNEREGGYDYSDGTQLRRPGGAIVGAAFDEDGGLDVVAGPRVGQQLIDQIAPTLVPQVMVGIDDGDPGLQDRLRRRAGQPVGPRREDAAVRGRLIFATHWVPRFVGICPAVPARAVTGGARRRSLRW